MKWLTLSFLICSSFLSLGQETSEYQDARLIGKWEFLSANVSENVSEYIHEDFLEPVSLEFFNDGLMLVFFDSIKNFKTTEWHTAHNSMLGLVKFDMTFDYSLDVDILILKAVGLKISLKKMDTHRELAKSTIDSIRAKHSIREINNQIESPFDAAEIEFFEEMEEEIIPEDAVEVFEIFDVSERAMFRGGEDSLQRFIYDNMVYPQMARDSSVQGTVNVMFVVNQKGDVQNLVILGIHKGYGLEAEAMRLIKQTSGLWKPAKQRNKQVNLRFRIPVKFELNR